MIRVLGTYIARRFVLLFAAVVVGLSALALTLDLMEQADRVLESRDGGWRGLLAYSALRLPDVAAQMLPIAVLLGMLATFGMFIRHHELVAMWTAGVSPAGLILALLPTAVVVGALHWANAELLVPDTRAALQARGWTEPAGGGFFGQNGAWVWLASGDDVVRLPRTAAAAGVVGPVSVFRRDAEGRLIERVDADGARPEGAGWRLMGVTVQTVDPAQTLRIPSSYWPGVIDLAALPLLSADRRDLGTADMLRLIEHEGFGQRPTERFRTWLQARIAAAATPALMMFLVVALAQRFRRAGAVRTLVLSGIAIGFLYSIFDGACLAFGESGLLPPWLAAWGPKLAMACVVGTFVVAGER